MKTREGYVSNSSSSSFLIPHEIKGRVGCIRLPDEIWQAIWRNHVEWDGTGFDLSASKSWWLTELVSDCCEEYNEISDIPNSIAYLEGNDEPYGCYEPDGERRYIKFRKDGQDFFVLASDFIDEKGHTDIPKAVELRDGAKRILGSKSLSKTQKLKALEFLFDF